MDVNFPHLYFARFWLFVLSTLDFGRGPHSLVPSSVMSTWSESRRFHRSYIVVVCINVRIVYTIFTTTRSTWLIQVQASMLCFRCWVIRNQHKRHKHIRKRGCRRVYYDGPVEFGVSFKAPCSVAFFRSPKRFVVVVSLTAIHRQESSPAATPATTPQVVASPQAMSLAPSRRRVPTTVVRLRRIQMCRCHLSPTLSVDQPWMCRK